MTSEIKSGKQQVKEVFEKWYTIPSYQRNYVWGEEQIDDLLTDLVDNFQQHPTNEFFLGSYVKQDNKADNSTDLLDGQQRITTLFLLFAVFRDFYGFPDLQTLVYQEESIMFQTPAVIRLNYKIRGGVDQFISKCILKKDSLKQNWTDIEKIAKDKTEKNESILHMCCALCYMKDFFDSRPLLDRLQFISFVLNKVVMIYISADNLEDAFRLFSIMNDRGIKLSSADILKSKNLEKLKNTKDMDSRAKVWEEMQEELGDGFDRFLMYVRACLVKARAKVNLLEEYEKNVFKAGLLNEGDDFFDTVSSYYTDYQLLINLDRNTDVAYCNLIRIMDASIPSTDWIPVLLYYYRNRKSIQGDNLLDFTKKLACKAVADMVCGDSPSVRIENLYKIMAEIDKAGTHAQLLSSGCFDFDQNVFVSNVNSDVYGRMFVKSLLMLLEYELQDNTIEKSFNKISIEHILPQTPASTSQWVKDFTQDERTAWTHKIGNLIIIGIRKNSSLGNKDYLEKRRLYFDKNIGSFARSLQLYNKYPVQWTLNELKQNQQDVLDLVKKVFRLSIQMPQIVSTSSSNALPLQTP